MKNLLLKITILILTLCLSSFILACDDPQEDEVQVTGTYRYRVATGTREVEKDGQTETESYKYYIITGFEVSSEDALKMAEGDFSSVEDYRKITIPSNGTDLPNGKDYPIEEISAGAFTNQIIFTEIVVGDNIKKIGEGAFAGCTNLQKLTLPFIGEKIDAVNNARVFGHVFGSSATNEGNTEVKAFINERKNDSGETILGETEVTFKVPTSLKTVDLSNSKIESISECAFYNMSTLNSVILPETVKAIDSHAFYGCIALKSFDLNKVEVIDQFAFADCLGLNSVDFKGVKTIKLGAFKGCTSLGVKKFVNDEESLTIKLPETVEVIGKKVFEGCTSIKYINLKGSKVNVIDNSAFSGCTSLVKIIINDNTAIRTSAFKGCAKLVKEGVVGTYTAEEKAFDFEDKE